MVMPDLNMCHHLCCLDATLIKRVALCEIPGKQAAAHDRCRWREICIQNESRNHPRPPDSFGWATVMDFGHWQDSNWQSSTDGRSAVGTLTSSATDSATVTAERLLCRCLRVTESDIREAISEHEPETVQGVSRICGAGSGCMSCHRHIRRMLNESALVGRSDQLPG
jgi:bacterioferritin-associated ferredoxin